MLTTKNIPFGFLAVSVLPYGTLLYGMMQLVDTHGSNRIIDTRWRMLVQRLDCKE